MLSFEKLVAGFAAMFGLGAVTGAAACCVLPLMFAGLGVSAAGLAPLVALYKPLSAVAFVAVAAGWLMFVRRRRACAVGVDCPPPSKLALALLIVSSLFVALAAIWPSIETPLTNVIR